MLRRPRNNLLVLAVVTVILGVMTTAVSYSVTLYRLFCAATGVNGDTQRTDANNTKVVNRKVTVVFNTDVAPNMPWAFEPVQRQVTIRLGENALVFFRAKNRSDKPIVGHATFNVTPEKAGIYFYKIQCFCFTEERLGPGESVEMPVDFYVDPALANDPGTADVKIITLSYTFLRSVDPADATDLSRFKGVAAVRKEADASRGAALFQERCSTCHSLEANKIGPSLRDVVGRKAGSESGYNYSPALKKSGITWTTLNLDRWLLGPRDFVPGVRMPIHVSKPQDRKDIIDFLVQQGTNPQTTPVTASAPATSAAN